MDVRKALSRHDRRAARILFEMMVNPFAVPLLRAYMKTVRVSRPDFAEDPIYKAAAWAERRWKLMGRRGSAGLISGSEAKEDAGKFRR